MNLLDFYKEHTQIDLEITDEEITKCLYLANRFNNNILNLDYLYHVFEATLSNLQNYKSYKECGFPEYFKNVSGNKLVRAGDYIGILDLWYPREICMFDLIQNPIMVGWIISDLLTKMEKIEDILSFSDPAKILGESIDGLLKEIKEIEFYGFYMGDARNSGRKKSIKIRRFEVEKIRITQTYLYRNLYPDMTLKDKDTNETLGFGGWNLGNWNFYLSKELLAERLKDLESFWMRGYDNKVRALDNEVRAKKKELENLINRRKNFENGITEYQKKLHDILWKSF